MLSNCLIPTYFLDEYQISDYKFVKGKSGICNTCMSNCNMTYTTYIICDKICTKTCYLCHIIINFKKYHSNKIFLIKSKMSQLDIIKEILKNYNNQKQIPNPIVLDKSCELISNLNLNDYIENSTHFLDVKIYFNPNILGHLENMTQNMFSKKKTEDNLSLLNYNHIVSFYNELKKLKIHNISNIKNKKVNNDILNSEKSFQNKQKNIEILMKIKKELI